MASKLIVAVFADISNFVKGMEHAASASKVLDKQVKELDIDVTKLANAQVKASVKATERLRSQVVAYRQLASSARKGSAEQVAAARLAETAEHKLARSLGATERETVRLRGQTRGFERDLGHAVRGAASGSGIFHGFGRSIAFASGGFIAFHTAGEFLRDSINAAREAGQAQRSLAAQMKTTGESFGANREQIEKVALSYGRFGFQNDEVVSGLTILQRGTGKLSASLKLLQLTADIARAKNIDFGASAQVVAKVFGGQETALRRAVPGLEKNAHGWDLIREAQRKMAGQAAANTTVSEKFAATLHDTEEIIGTALLPVLNKYLTSLSKWLQHMNESGRLQKDVTEIVKGLTTAIGVLRGAFNQLNSVTGSTKNTLEVLLGVFVGFKALKWASELKTIATNIGLIGRNAARATPEVEGLAGAEADAAAGGGGIGGALRKPRAAGGGFFSKARGLGLPLVFNPITLLTAGTAIALRKMQVSGQKAAEEADKAFTQGWKKGSRLETTLVPLYAERITNALKAGVPVKQIRLSIEKELGKSLAAEDLIGEAFAYATGSDSKLKARIEKAMRRGWAKASAIVTDVTSGGYGGGIKVPPPRTVEQLNNWFDAMIQRQLGRVQDITSLAGQNRRLEEIRDKIKERLKKTKDITRQLKLQDEVLDINRTIAANTKQKWANFMDALDLRAEMAAATKTLNDDIAVADQQIAAIEKEIKKEGRTTELLRALFEAQQRRAGFVSDQHQQRRDARRAAREAAAQAKASAMQRKIDWAEFAYERAQDTKGMADDVKTLKILIAYLKEQIRLTGLTVDRARELRDKQKLLREALHPSGGGGRRRRPDEIPAGIDPTSGIPYGALPAGGAVLGGGAAGVYKPSAPSGGFQPAPASYQIHNLNLFGVQDVPGLEQQLQKRSHARPQTRRGPV